MYKLWGLLPVICRLPNDSGFDHKQVSILKIAKINITLVHYILCRIYWPTTFGGPTETTTITVISHSDFAVVVYTFLSGTSWRSYNWLSLRCESSKI